MSHSTQKDAAAMGLQGAVIAFIGGGNMAHALIDGLLRSGGLASQLIVVEPSEPQRQRLSDKLGVTVLAAPGPALGRAQLVVWAVKPQYLRAAVQENACFLDDALHISIVAGIRTMDLARWLDTRRLVRAMPNTPAMVGAGMTGLVALPEVGEDDRQRACQLMSAVGSVMWVADDAGLDAVTAVSGSGPAYVFYFMEALQAAATELGFSAQEARALTLQTFQGAVAQAAGEASPFSLLRERVTSPGGTTQAALTRLQAGDILTATVKQAVAMACQRAAHMADEFGKN